MGRGYALRGGIERGGRHSVVTRWSADRPWTARAARPHMLAPKLACGKPESRSCGLHCHDGVPDLDLVTFLQRLGCLDARAATGADDPAGSEPGLPRCGDIPAVV